LVVKDSVRLAPFADACYAYDAKWWVYHKGLPDFAGLKISMVQTKNDLAKAKDYGRDQWPYADVIQLANGGATGLDTDPSMVRTGKNSGYQAMNVAVHLGGSRIVLLGYDMQHTYNKHHFFGRHPWNTAPITQRFIPEFEGMLDDLKRLNVSVVNATRETALHCFDEMSLEEALP